MATFTRLKSSSWRAQVRRKGTYVNETFLRRRDAGRPLAAPALLLLTGLAAIAQDHHIGPPAGATGGSGPSAPMVGVRHWVTASVHPARSTADEPGDTATRLSSLTLRIQISDHAPDLRFYGIVAKTWTDVDRRTGTSETIVWEAARCHRERGTPKVGVVSLDGRSDVAPVAALVRQRGRRMPTDEIVVRKVLTPQAPTALLAIDATTTTSGLGIRVTLHGETCRL
ncbi:hypothetical protein RHODGE_RHODGE_01985 [Rhodoplanes serenus]|uniref:Uncharacterized protein n=1 Tax=Rhodoplanes serenus TaxID=200615 RepID=A0A447CU97_9BRAD|nr:hypothetical protein RHODGE_RHODGE_01985 [Rhodoplanes serenus]